MTFHGAQLIASWPLETLDPSKVWLLQPNLPRYLATVWEAALAAAREDRLSRAVTALPSSVTLFRRGASLEREVRPWIEAPTPGGLDALTPFLPEIAPDPSDTSKARAAVFGNAS